MAVQSLLQGVRKNAQALASFRGGAPGRLFDRAWEARLVGSPGRKTGGALDRVPERAQAAYGRNQQLREIFRAGSIAAGAPPLDFRKLDILQKIVYFSFALHTVFHVSLRSDSVMRRLMATLILLFSILHDILEPKV